MPASLPPAVAAALLVLLAYLLGSVSGSLVLGRLRGVDIRQHGSGNGVAAIDIGKGVLATWLALRMAPLDAPLSVTAQGYAAAAAATLGHVWPVWHGFRGGKGAATLAGGLLVLWPWIIPLLLLAWILVLTGTGYVGLATMVAGALLAVLALATGAEAARLAFCVFAAVFLLFTHRANLQRLRAGNESRFERARLLHRLYRGGRP